MAYFEIGRTWNGVESKVSTYRDGGTYGIDSNHFVLICTNNPATGNGTIISSESFIAVYNPYSWGLSSMSFKYKVASFTKSGNIFTLYDLTNTWGEYVINDPSSISIYTTNLIANGLSVDIPAGGYIGLIVERVEPEILFFPVFGGYSSVNLGYYSTGSASPYTCSIVQNINGDVSDILISGICETVDGDLPNPSWYGQPIPENCYTYNDDVEAPGWYNGYGYLRLDSIQTNPYRAIIDVKTPWLSEHHNVVFYEGVEKEFRNPLNNLEVYTVTVDEIFSFSGYEGISKLTNCWKTSTPYNERWVSISGNDANDGLSYTRPMRKITTAINDIDDGGTIHVMKGLYDEETAFNSLSKSIQISPENTNWNKTACTVNVITSGLNSQEIGNLQGGTGWGGDIGNNSLTVFSTSTSVPTTGRITTLEALLSLYDGTANAIIIRPEGSNQYRVIYNRPFDVQTSTLGSTKQICSSSVSIDVEAGDIYGVCIYGGSIAWREQSISGTYIGNYYNFQTGEGDLVTLNWSTSTGGEISIKYTILTI